jgi:hypothetical protein
MAGKTGKGLQAMRFPRSVEEARASHGSPSQPVLALEGRQKSIGHAPARSRSSTPAWRVMLAPALVVWALQRAAALPLTLLAALLAHSALDPQTLLTRWIQWDANWYVSIAALGYYVKAATAFFPLFPGLTAAVNVGLGFVYWHDTVLAALIVANGASLAALLGIGMLARDEFGGTNAGTRAMLAMAAYPVAFFLISPYADNLLLATSVFALYFARQGRWRWVAVCGVLAGLSRPTSIVLVVPLTWEYGRQHGWWRRDWWRYGWWRRDWWRDWFQRDDRLRVLREVAPVVLAVGAVPAAVGAFLLFLAVRYSDPLIYSQAQRATWGLVTLPPWQTLALMAHSALHPPTDTLFRLIIVVDWSAFFAAVAITLLWARRLPVVYTLYNAALLVLLLCSPIPSRPEIITSSARHVLTAFPIFLVASQWMRGRPRLSLVLLAVGFALQAIFMVWFLTGHWIE